MEFIPIYKRPVTARIPRPLRILRDSYSRPEPLIHPCHERELLKQTAAGEPTQHSSRKAAMLPTKRWNVEQPHPASRCIVDQVSNSCHRSGRLLFFLFSFCFAFLSFFFSLCRFTRSPRPAWRWKSRSRCLVARDRSSHGTERDNERGFNRLIVLIVASDGKRTE